MRVVYRENRSTNLGSVEVRGEKEPRSKKVCGNWGEKRQADSEAHHNWTRGCCGSYDRPPEQDRLQGSREADRADLLVLSLWQSRRSRTGTRYLSVPAPDGKSWQLRELGLTQDGGRKRRMLFGIGKATPLTASPCAHERLLWSMRRTGLAGGLKGHGQGRGGKGGAVLSPPPPREDMGFRQALSAPRAKIPRQGCPWRLVRKYYVPRR